MSQHRLTEAIEQMIASQKQKLLRYGREVIPHLTEDDLLQPNDYPELETHPLFRYEEGFLAALLAVQMAFQRISRE